MERCHLGKGRSLQLRSFSLHNSSYPLQTTSFPTSQLPRGHGRDSPVRGLLWLVTIKGQLSRVTPPHRWLNCRESVLLQKHIGFPSSSYGQPRAISGSQEGVSLNKGRWAVAAAALLYVAVVRVLYRIRRRDRVMPLQPLIFPLPLENIVFQLPNPLIQLVDIGLSGA